VSETALSAGETITAPYDLCVEYFGGPDDGRWLRFFSDPYRQNGRYMPVWRGSNTLAMRWVPS
jgi:hypothetical protein